MHVCVRVCTETVDVLLFPCFNCPIDANVTYIRLDFAVYEFYGMETGFCTLSKYIYNEHSLKNLLYVRDYNRSNVVLCQHYCIGKEPLFPRGKEPLFPCGKEPLFPCGIAAYTPSQSCGQ